jgi:hypothetical protein
MAVGAIAGIAALAVGEMAARLALPDIDPTRQIAFISGRGDVPTLGPRNTSLRQVKNTGDFNVAVRFGPQGFRDLKDVAKAGPDDILVAGDSFMMGWGVEEAERTSDRLAALSGRTVYNVAIPTGIDGFHHSLDYARRLGGRFSKVVVGVTMEMDVNVYPPYQPLTALAEPEPAAPSGEAALPKDLSGWKTWLRDHSALYFIATGQVHNNPLLRAVATGLGLVKPNLAGIHEHKFSPEAVTSSADQLSAIARDYETLVLIIPSRALWHGAGTKEESHRHEAFVAALNEHGLDVLDLRPLMEAGGAPLSFHFANDGHWRPAGHDLAARALAERVRARWPQD